MREIFAATLFAVLAVLAVFAAPVFADDRALITHYEQELSDAITDGKPAVWVKYLDPDVIYAEEDDTGSPACCELEDE